MKIIVDGEVFELQTEYDFTTDTLTILDQTDGASFQEVSSDHKKFAKLLGIKTHKEKGWDDF